MTKIPFGITLYGGHAIINLRCKLNTIEFETMRDCYPAMCIFQNNGFTYMRGILIDSIYNDNFYPDYRIAMIASKMQDLASQADSYHAFKESRLAAYDPKDHQKYTPEQLAFLREIGQL